MHAHTPPFTKPEAAYDSRGLYDETSAIAAAQDAKRREEIGKNAVFPASMLEAVSSTEAKVRTALSYLYHAQELLKEAFPKPQERAQKWSQQWASEQGVPAESAYLASFGPNGSRIATAAEIDSLRDLLGAEELKGFGIGDVEPRHVMHAEALRDHDERLSGPEDQL